MIYFVSACRSLDCRLVGGGAQAVQTDKTVLNANLKCEMKM